MSLREPPVIPPARFADYLTFQAGMLLKIREQDVRYEVRGVRELGVNLHSKVQTGALDRVRNELAENYVPSRNVIEK